MEAQSVIVLLIQTWFYSLSFVGGEEYPEPVAFYPLNKLYGTRDISKSNLTSATAVGVTLATGPDGKEGGSYYFQGSASSYIDIPKHDKIDTRFSLTVLAWVYSTGKDGPLLHYHVGRKSEYAIHMYIVSKHTLLVRPARRDYLLLTKPSLKYTTMPVNSWVHVGYVYDGTTARHRLFIDGVKVKFAIIEKFPLATQYKVRIGGAKYGDTRLFKGRVTCVQIYDRAIPKDNILAARSYCGRDELDSSCSEYKSLDDPTRATDNTVLGQPSDGQSLSRIHWYRLKDKQIPSSPPVAERCGTKSPGWLSGHYPSREAGIVKMKICYREGLNTCASKSHVFMRKCYGFYVFKFDDIPYINGRFCTEPDRLQNIPDAMFLSSYMKCLSGRVFFSEVNVTEVSKCVAYCLRAAEDCKSINFLDEENGKCQLNNATMSDGVLVDNKSCTYYEPV